MSSRPDRLPFEIAARYPDEMTSAPPYQESQALIFQHEELALSVFRLQLRRLPPIPDGWIVAIVGLEPSEEHQTHLRRILSAGESIELPDDVMAALRARREALCQQGPWVENHYGAKGRRLL